MSELNCNTYPRFQLWPQRDKNWWELFSWPCCHLMLWLGEENTFTFGFSLSVYQLKIILLNYCKTEVWKGPSGQPLNHPPPDFSQMSTSWTLFPLHPPLQLSSSVLKYITLSALSPQTTASICSFSVWLHIIEFCHCIFLMLKSPNLILGLVCK